MMTPYMPIVPQVASFRPEGTSCALARGLELADTHETACPPALQEQIEAWLDTLAPATPPQKPIALSFQLAESGNTNGQDRGQEAYRITIQQGAIKAQAGTETGLFYALQSLKQAVAAARHDTHATLPTGVIEDHPRFAWRGAMLDSARHMQSVSWIKRFLDRMASLKLNRFHWHLTDDEGWRAEIRKHPQLTSTGAWRGQGDTRYGGYYTQADMREIVAHAKALHIQVIPEIEMPGHCNAALAANPELACTDQAITIITPGDGQPMSRRAARRAFCAANEVVYQIIADVLKELADVFDPQYLHIGGDETPRDAWQKCPRCQDLMRLNGYTTTDELRTHFLTRVHETAQRDTGIPTIAWTEKVRDDLPRTQLTHAWFPGEAAAAARLGRTTINSNHEWTYLDYPSSTAEARDRPDWMIILPLEKVYHFDPLPEGLEENQHHLILGSEAPIWTEYTPDEASLERQIMPRLAAFAEALWSPRQGRSYDGFLKRWHAADQPLPSNPTPRPALHA
ncbi:MAG: beta-N-acetylhexosaminidase [Phycisphaeraceae bacterium]